MKSEMNPVCPHCSRTMVREEIPDIGYDYDVDDSESGDEFGWESPFLWICINNECPLFINSWKHMAENHGQLSSLRYMVQPYTGETGVIAAFNPDTLAFLIKEKKKTQGLQT